MRSSIVLLFLLVLPWRDPPFVEASEDSSILSIAVNATKFSTNCAGYKSGVGIPGFHSGPWCSNVPVQGPYLKRMTTSAKDNRSSMCSIFRPSPPVCRYEANATKNEVGLVMVFPGSTPRDITGAFNLMQGPSVSARLKGSQRPALPTCGLKRPLPPKSAVWNASIQTNLERVDVAVFRVYSVVTPGEGSFRLTKSSALVPGYGNVTILGSPTLLSSEPGFNNTLPAPDQVPPTGMGSSMNLLSNEPGFEITLTKIRAPDQVPPTGMGSSMNSLSKLHVKEVPPTGMGSSMNSFTREPGFEITLTKIRAPDQVPPIVVGSVTDSIKTSSFAFLFHSINWTALFLGAIVVLNIRQLQTSRQELARCEARISVLEAQVRDMRAQMQCLLYRTTSITAAPQVLRSRHKRFKPTNLPNSLLRFFLEELFRDNLWAHAATGLTETRHRIVIEAGVNIKHTLLGVSTSLLECRGALREMAVKRARIHFTRPSGPHGSGLLVSNGHSSSSHTMKLGKAVADKIMLHLPDEKGVENKSAVKLTEGVEKKNAVKLTEGPLVADQASPMPCHTTVNCQLGISVETEGPTCNIATDTTCQVVRMTAMTADQVDCAIADIETTPEAADDTHDTTTVVPTMRGPVSVESAVESPSLHRLHNPRSPTRTPHSHSHIANLPPSQKSPSLRLPHTRSRRSSLKDESVVPVMSSLPTQIPFPLDWHISHTRRWASLLNLSASNSNNAPLLIYASLAAHLRSLVSANQCSSELALSVEYFALSLSPRDSKDASKKRSAQSREHSQSLTPLSYSYHLQSPTSKPSSPSSPSSRHRLRPCSLDIGFVTSFPSPSNPLSLITIRLPLDNDALPSAAHLFDVIAGIYGLSSVGYHHLAPESTIVRSRSRTRRRRSPSPAHSDDSEPSSVSSPVTSSSTGSWNELDLATSVSHDSGMGELPLDLDNRVQHAAVTSSSSMDNVSEAPQERAEDGAESESESDSESDTEVEGQGDREMDTETAYALNTDETHSAQKKYVARVAASQDDAKQLRGEEVAASAHPDASTVSEMVQYPPSPPRTTLPGTQTSIDTLDSASTQLQADKPHPSSPPLSKAPSPPTSPRLTHTGLLEGGIGRRSRFSPSASRLFQYALGISSSPSASQPHLPLQRGPVQPSSQVRQESRNVQAAPILRGRGFDTGTARSNPAVLDPRGSAPVEFKARHRQHRHDSSGNMGIATHWQDRADGSSDQRRGRGGSGGAGWSEAGRWTSGAPLPPMDMQWSWSGGRKESDKISAWEKLRSVRR
ncbi:hypothetical protein HDU93_002119 [Gonapodya sp. JEL0774]|nr:hypothetical protein HDU93_002119 [Gonapodya sp. JEL0774]